MTSIELDLGLHPRQLQAFESDATEILFGGASEGGKSHFARCFLIIWCLKIPNLQCVLIRKKYADILNNHLEGRTGFRNLLAPLTQLKQVDITQNEIRFFNGSRIIFQHCQDERQFDSAQGVERQILVIDEATQISERLIRFFRGWVRMPKEAKEAIPEEYRSGFPKILYTANPIGVSVNFFRRNFVKCRKAFEIEKVEGFKRQYIPSRATDNLSVDQEAHKGRLEGIGDPVLARVLDEGDWDAPTGEFFPEWDEKRHVVASFTPPSHFYRFRTFDWGTADPAVVYWVCISDGEPFTPSDGKQRWFPKGALIVYNEWYMCDETNPAKGSRMRNEDIARGIIDRSEYEHRNVVTITDSLPFQDRGGETIAMVFQKNSVLLTQGDTSRVPGWSQLRSRLIGIEIDSNENRRVPMIYFTENCKYARDYIPALPRHPRDNKREDAAEHGEATHCCDAIRLACMVHPIIRHSQVPIQTRIDKEIKASKPTIGKIARSMGNAYFN